MKLSDILTESILDEISIGDLARKKQDSQKPVSMGDRLRKMAVKLVNMAVQYNRSYEDTLSRYINRCKILKKKDDRIDLATCKEIFDGIWKGITKQGPQGSQGSSEFRSMRSAPGATRT